MCSQCRATRTSRRLKSNEIEMEGLTGRLYWQSPEGPLDRDNNNLALLYDLVITLDEWVRSQTASRRTLRQIVLERLEAASPEGSKAAAIRAYAKDNLQRAFSAAAVGATLNRLAKQGRARREGHVWFLVQQGAEAGEDPALSR